ncbi:hypothetical protein NG791_24140 [Laspinema sp. D1]|uniref:hypothetical protein n=1 Tax=Laspinema palackyanum TaxID=3231601 RepID=UPI0034714F1A|nr:hypothetical protein [Laspinema sp. D2b]
MMLGSVGLGSVGLGKPNFITLGMGHLSLVICPWWLGRWGRKFVVTTSVVAKSVMASAMTRRIGGWSACLGTGGRASKGA